MRNLSPGRSWVSTAVLLFNYRRLTMRIAIGCDHGALEMKNALISRLEGQGYQVQDFGTYTKDSCDYTDFAAAAANPESRVMTRVVIPTVNNPATMPEQAPILVIFLENIPQI